MKQRTSASDSQSRKTGEELIPGGFLGIGENRLTGEAAETGVQAGAR
jgi:hypothetical protein